MTCGEKIQYVEFGLRALFDAPFSARYDFTCIIPYNLGTSSAALLGNRAPCYKRMEWGWGDYLGHGMQPRKSKLTHQLL